MSIFRIAMMVLAIINFLFAALTAAVGQFADGGDIWSRLILSVLHPTSAIAILALVFIPRPKPALIKGTIALLLINIVADASLATLIATGAIKGDWPLPLVFTAVPAIAILYAAVQLRNLQSTDDNLEPSSDGPIH